MLKIEIDGSRAGPDAIGLSLASGSEESRISGLVINRFLSTGVLLQAAVPPWTGITLGPTRREPRKSFRGSHLE